MNDIGLIVLTGNIIIGFIYLLGMFFLNNTDITYPNNYRIYWKKKDIFKYVFKLFIGIVIFIGWLFLMKYVNVSITTKNEDLLKYLNVSIGALIIFGGFFTYYIYKHFIKVFIGSLSYFIQKRKTISDQLLKAINENDSSEVINNIKLTIQSGNYQYIGSQEYTRLLNILIKNEEYTVANELVKTRFKFLENSKNPKLCGIERNSSL